MDEQAGGAGWDGGGTNVPNCPAVVCPTALLTRAITALVVRPRVHVWLYGNLLPGACYALVRSHRPLCKARMTVYLGPDMRIMCLGPDMHSHQQVVQGARVTVLPRP